MFGIGGTELFILIIFAVLLFGPDKLPQLGRTIGKFTKEFKRAQDSMEAKIKQEMDLMEGKKPEAEAESATKPAKPKDWLVDEEEEEEEEE